MNEIEQHVKEMSQRLHRDPERFVVEGVDLSESVRVGEELLHWSLDSYGVLHLIALNPLNPVEPDDTVDAWIEKRPLYCDRGHYKLNVDGRFLGHDASDGFPRYFMSLRNAVDETERYLNWRLYKIP